MDAKILWFPAAVIDRQAAPRASRRRQREMRPEHQQSRVGVPSQNARRAFFAIGPVRMRDRVSNPARAALKLYPYRISDDPYRIGGDHFVRERMVTH